MPGRKTDSQPANSSSDRIWAISASDSAGDRNSCLDGSRRNKACLPNQVRDCATTASSRAGSPGAPAAAQSSGRRRGRTRCLSGSVTDRIDGPGQTVEEAAGHRIGQRCHGGRPFRALQSSHCQAPRRSASAQPQPQGRWPTRTGRRCTPPPRSARPAETRPQYLRRMPVEAAIAIGLDLVHTVLMPSKYSSGHSVTGPGISRTPPSACAANIRPARKLPRATSAATARRRSPTAGRNRTRG
jgi:hypothetical protein